MTKKTFAALITAATVTLTGCGGGSDIDPAAHDEAQQWAHDEITATADQYAGDTTLTGRAVQAIEDVTVDDGCTAVQVHLGVSEAHPDAHDLLTEAADWAATQISTRGDVPACLADNLVRVEGHAGQLHGQDARMSDKPAWNA